jgi:MoaA/NifB/PqqE/SkfB family radical SAM enzyme
MAGELKKRGFLMKKRSEFPIDIDGQGRGILPREVVSRYGMGRGMKIYIEDGENGDGLNLGISRDPLAKVYIEPTNRCNLECRTCMRNIWDEPLGQMESSTFTRILDGLGNIFPPPKIFFGGIGEPLAHPRIAEMVGQAKKIGSSVELITNGTLLTRDMSHRLLQAGLDMLWVSLDGATPESYADVRLGSALPEVLANIAAYRKARQTEYTQRAHLGIVFVAMKRNIADLPALLKLGRDLGARRFLVSNVLPYTAEMREEILYARSRMDFFFGPFLELPIIDINETTFRPLYEAFDSGKSVVFSGPRNDEEQGRCPFIGSRSTAVSWEGNLSPCLPLLHSHNSFLDRRERFSRRHIVGSVNEKTLQDLWRDPQYAAFRERVRAFDFSPCAICGGCEMGEGNEEDCFGNEFPTCGGCLWAQGVVQCP